MVMRCMQESTRRRLGWLVLAWVLSAVVLTGCHHAPAEQQVREAIGTAAAAARNNDVHGVLAEVSDDFTGNDGEFDQRGLHRLLALRALRQDQTGVLVGPITFDHKSLPRSRSGGDRIIAKFNLVLTGGKLGDLLPDKASIYRMTTAWRREGSTWRCYSATWSR